MLKNDARQNGTFDMEADLLEILKMHAGAAYIRFTSAKIRLADEFGIEEGYCRAEQILAARVAA
jgi:hypothetical protein